jgi:hypothetical protein
MDDKKEKREGDRGGPPGTDWLDLEVSKMLYGRAEAIAKKAIEELLAESIKARLRERLGPRLDAVARIAADQVAADIEANLAIEAQIDARRAARRELGGLIGEAFGREAPPKDDAPPGEMTGEGWDPRKM